MAADELTPALDWSQQMLHRMLAVQELQGALLHLISAERQVDVVLLSADDAQLVQTARALIVVRAPAVAILATEAWSVTLDEATAQRDPLLRDWWHRRTSGQQAKVRELPRDYVDELLILDGESADGAHDRRLWRIAGAPPTRTFPPYTPQPGVHLAPSEPTQPLFLVPHALQAGIDPDTLRRSAQHYLAHGHHFRELYSAKETE